MAPIVLKAQKVDWFPLFPSFGGLQAEGTTSVPQMCLTEVLKHSYLD